MYLKEITIKHEDGNTYAVRVGMDVLNRLMIDTVFVKEKRKRKFTNVCGKNMTDQYEYRVLDIEKRREYKQRLLMESVPEKVMSDALMQVWEDMKPKYILYGY